MSDNQPQVGTRLDAMCDVCGRAFAEHRSGLLNEAYCPRFVEAHWYGWLPTTFVPQPTPAEPRIETDLAQRAKLQARLGNRKAVIDPQDIGAPRLNEEPRIETVHDSFTCETPNCPACWGESKQEGVEGDYVGIGRNGPTSRVEAGAQPEPDEFQQDWADYDRRGIAGGWEKVAFASGWGRGFKRGEARAGSSLSPDLQNLAQVARAKRTAWHEDFGVPISQTYAEFLEAIGLLIEACERASPPSSPGAARTCPACGSTDPHDRRSAPYPYHSDNYCGHPFHLSSPGAPQEQK